MLPTVIEKRIHIATLGTLINVRVLIIVRVGSFGKNNKHAGANKHTVWKIYRKLLSKYAKFAEIVFKSAI